MSWTEDAASAPLLDRAELDTNTMANRDLQRELFGLYFGQGPALFGKLEGGLAEAAPRPWREAAHALKGTARTLGLMRLGAVAAAAEAGAPCEDLLADLKAEFAEAQRAAAAYLATAATAA